jgi:hypothetical protein
MLDYHRGVYVEFPEFRYSDNFLLLQVNSNTQSFERLYDAVRSFLSPDSGPVLLIHINPVEGPLYIDTHFRVQISNLNDLIEAANETLGVDLLNVSQSVIPEAVRLS